MKRALIFLLLLLSLALPALARDVQVCGPVVIYFNPHGGCTEAIVAEIDRAASSVHVQARHAHADQGVPGGYDRITGLPAVG